MKTRNGTHGWTALFLGLTITMALGQGEQWLQYRTSQEPKAYRWIDLTNVPPTDVVWPKLGPQAQYAFWKTPLDPKGGRWLCLDRSGKSGPCDRLYIDSNGNGRLDDETPLKAVERQDSMSSFEPARLVFKGEDGPLTYHLVCRFYQFSNERARLLTGSSGYYEGKVSLGGKKHQVQLIDNTINGVFNDQSGNPSDCDRIVVDGDDSTARYLGRWLELDNQLFEIKVAPDGAFVKVQPATNVVMGSVRVPETISEFTAVGLNGHFVRKPAKGEFTLPMGKYRVHGWTIDRKDSRGMDWRLAGSGFTEAANFEVSPGQTTSLEIGEPIRTVLDATPTKSEFSFSLRFQGNLGESLEITKGKQNERPEPPPRLTVASETGAFRSTNNFQYG